MDHKSGGSQSSITTIQSIGKEWGSLRQHNEPLYIKKLREKRKGHREEQKHITKVNKPAHSEPDEKNHEKGDTTSFEIVV
jgi:hypothetical protein